jgi:hypothetical protein
MVIVESRRMYQGKSCIDSPLKTQQFASRF